MHGETILAVIPARFASTRFPGKLLESLHGRPILEHVWRRARRISTIDRLLIATDDERIAATARAFGADVAMTASTHSSGTDRIGEVVMTRRPAPEFVLNLQGDEPLFSVRDVDRLCVSMREQPDAIWTLAHPIHEEEEFRRPSVVKVVLNDDARALYFSRAPIPHFHHREASLDRAGASALRHVGIYGYPYSILERFIKTKPTPLERTEGLEQLRALEVGLPIRVLRTETGSFGIDTPEDLEAIRSRYPTAEALEAAAPEAAAPGAADHR